MKTLRCIRCKTYLPETSFRLQRGIKGYKNGIRRFNMCSPCEKEYKHDWYLRHQEREKSKRHQHYIKNRDSYIKRAQDWMIGNIEQYRHNQSIYQRKRRQLIMEKTTVSLTHKQWEEIKSTFNYCCAYCLKPFKRLEKEHMIPVSKKGDTVPDNIVPSCPSCNKRKGNRTLLEYVSEV